MNKLILSTLILSIAAVPSSWAKNSHREKINWATVTNVQPITRVVEQRFPNKECWDEPVRYKQRASNGQSHTGVIIGSIIGGAIGNNISNHNKAGTVIGAVLGASIGNDISNQGSHRGRTETYYRRQCQVNNRVSYQEAVVGYDVWYRYQGNEYKTQMDHHPGNKIKVRINIEPY